MIILLGIGFQLLQLVLAFKDRKKNPDTTGNPWHGGTLEWTTTSPPPFYNFAVVPTIDDRNPIWADEEKGLVKQKPHYEDFHMPNNSPLGIYIGGFSFLFGWAQSGKCIGSCQSGQSASSSV